MKTYEELSEEYDELYKRAELFIEKYNPCKVSNGKCLRAQRCGQNFCCRHCKYLKEKGCSVKSLTCKVWFDCGFTDYRLFNLEEYKKLMEDTKIFFCHRGSKEDSIKLALIRLSPKKI